MSLSLFSFALLNLSSLNAKPYKTIQFPSLDRLKITADLYYDGDRQKSFILLFHQAAFSRAAYREIAPLLVKRGFNAMAIDQRSGKKALGVQNETAARAAAQKKSRSYLAAEQDLRAAIHYVRTQLKVKRIVLWGSSYSASLVLKLAGETAPLAVVAFSPGEYFGNRLQVAKAAASIGAPVWISSTRKESPAVRKIFRKIPSKKKFFYLHPRLPGTHGSRALWSSNAGYKDYRKSLFRFLSSLSSNFTGDKR